ncbi:hypothetical protein [Clostridium folliculivorans]|uniref:Uncharacterized protein n=1 Tax=Clostridium folliculivorans TaxID=2886038 RepID=A0A9W6DAH7_9CLOT|nr:hypothetical protein [Clostridium folliculivorans]GKU25229.1 hypothetical protein CFOLD11_20550 [Clostridium folliculivorans]GKU31327.1 hypothetical protein CFB3_34340 [Clostridium folliculivorans]
MKFKKIFLIIIILIILYIPASFIYTRFCLPQYKMNDNTITYKENVYVRNDSISSFDEKNVGKAIGIAIYKKRTLTDYIWPFWVSEFKDDKEHNRIFVKGLMDLGSEYDKK